MSGPSRDDLGSAFDIPEHLQGYPFKLDQSDLDSLFGDPDQLVWDMFDSLLKVEHPDLVEIDCRLGSILSYGNAPCSNQIFLALFVRTRLSPTEIENIPDLYSYIMELINKYGKGIAPNPVSFYQVTEHSERQKKFRPTFENGYKKVRECWTKERWDQFRRDYERKSKESKGPRSTLDPSDSCTGGGLSCPNVRDAGEYHGHVV